MMLNRYLFTAGLLILASIPSNAAMYRGFSNAAGSETMSFTEPVDRFIETKDEFLILFARHPSFLFFPKTKKNELEFRDFLKARAKTRKQISVSFNPRTLKINSLKD